MMSQPLSPGAVRLYFQRLYDLKGDQSQSGLDAAVVQGQRGIIRAITATAADATFPYASIADAFKMIDQDTVPVLVPWPADKAAFEALQARLLQPVPSRDARREAQAQTVSIPRSALGRLLASGKVQPLAAIASDMLYKTTVYSRLIGFELDPFAFPGEDGIF